MTDYKVRLTDAELATLIEWFYCIEMQEGEPTPEDYALRERLLGVPVRKPVPRD